MHPSVRRYLIQIYTSMKKYLFIILLFCGSCAVDESNYVAYENGLWFNGSEFVEETHYSKNGRFITGQPARIDTVFNLSGKYIIPPFGDAHTHELADTSDLKEMLPRYIENGIFYVQVLTNHSSKIAEFRDEFDSPNTIDVVYANGGLTSTLGHPFVAYETQAMGLHWSAMFSQREKVKESRLAEKDAYWFLDSPDDVQQQWEEIMSSRPDVIKIFLINTADHEELFKSESMGNFGLSVKTAQSVVTKAKENGLRIVAHVETADDFRIGLDLGVDGFGHLPGYSWNGQDSPEQYRLTEDDLTRAAQNDIFITPTAIFARVYATRYEPDGTPTLDEERLETVNQFLFNQIQRLHRAGVQLAIGSDQYRETSLLELNYLHNELDLFDAATLLRMGTVTTSSAIFPGRKIGKFENGYEASFIALDDNPLVDWSALQEIHLRVKQGHVLEL